MKIVDCKWFKLCKPWRMRMKVLTHMLRQMHGLIVNEWNRGAKARKVNPSTQLTTKNVEEPGHTGWVVAENGNVAQKCRGDVEDKQLGVRFPRYVLLDTRAFMSVFSLIWETDICVSQLNAQLWHNWNEIIRQIFSYTTRLSWDTMLVKDKMRLYCELAM